MISILFLAADPTNASRLRLGEEAREIQEKLQLAKLRDNFAFNQRFSVRPSDITQSLLDTSPQVVHFSGHGASTGELFVEDKAGRSHSISPEALSALFEQFSGQVDCVILNACYSEAQAQAIAKHIDYVIGMNQAIGDRAAIAFSVGFYQALGAGRSIEDAFKFGCIQIKLENIPEHLTPVLIMRDPAHVTSIGSGLRDRRVWTFIPRQEFVGRAEEKKVYLQVLEQIQTSNTPNPQALLISGEGGIGKSWLLNELCAESREKELKVFYVDLAIEEPTGTSPKVVLYTLREQGNELGLSDRFPNFDHALNRLRSLDLESQDYLKVFGSHDSISSLSSKWLTDGIISDLSQIARKQTVVLVIDGSEKASGFANWLRINFLARLSGRFLLIISGRRDSLMEFVSVFGPSRVHQCRLNPFDAVETERYFGHYEIALEEELALKIIRLTKGNPLATSMLASLVISRSGRTSISELLDDLPKSEIVAGMARYLLADLSPDDLEIVYAMSIFRAFDGAVLAHVLKLEKDVNVEKLAQQLPFLSLSNEGWRMHETVASVMFDFFRQARPTQFRQANERAAEFWQNSMITLEANGVIPPARYSNREWARATNYLFWHLMLSNEDKAAQFVMLQFLKALAFRINFITLLELADDLEEHLLVVPRAVGILRAVYRSAINGPLAQFKQDLLTAKSMEFCCGEANAYLDKLLQEVEEELKYLSTRVYSELKIEDRWGVCRGQCDCDCACPILSLETFSYYLELTPDCNNVCPGCLNTFIDRTMPNWNRDESPYLNAKEWKVILSKVAPNTSTINITGGEPTLHPDFEEIIIAIEELNVPFVLFSNGRWSNPRLLVEMLKGISCCQGLLISLHGTDPEAHEAFSGVAGCFSETVENIRLAIESGLSVSISTVLTTRNCDQIENIVELANRLNVSQIIFNRYIGHLLSDLELSPQALRQTVRNIERLRKEGAKVRFGPCIPSCFVLSSAKGCVAGTSFAAIDPWGNVKPCSHAPLIVGNLVKQSLRSIWNSKGMVYWDTLIPSTCMLCSEFTTCHGGCRASALLVKQGQDPLINNNTFSTYQKMQEWIS